MVDNSKQGIEIYGDNVFKKHESVERAGLEQDIARLYSGNGLVPIATPEIYGVVRNGLDVFLEMEKIEGTSLIGNKDQETTRRLVRDLALFHEMFSQNPEVISSSSLYRDAINSNYLSVGEGYVHIDFSSSNRFNHCLDDLALLVHPLWNETTPEQREAFVKEYFRCRSEFNVMGLSVVDQIDHSLIGNRSVEERRTHYASSIRKMEDEGVESGGISSEIGAVDFEILKTEDFKFFFTYRTIRGEYYLTKVWKVEE